jgi:hypothetical protein
MFPATRRTRKAAGFSIQWLSGCIRRPTSPSNGSLDASTEAPDASGEAPNSGAVRFELPRNSLSIRDFDPRRRGAGGPRGATIPFVFSPRSPSGLIHPRHLDEHGRDIIEQIIDQVTAALSPSDSINLSGFLQDADYYFFAHPAFAAAEIERTPDPASLVRIKLTLADDVATLQAVANALREVWHSILYNHFEACSITWYREATCLRFVTVVGNDLFHVTGTAYALGAGYTNLVAAFDRDFGIYGPLPGVPGGLPSWAV